LECDFHNQVRFEEGPSFVTGSELVEIVMYGNKIMQRKLDLGCWKPKNDDEDR